MSLSPANRGSPSTWSVDSFAISSCPVTPFPQSSSTSTSRSRATVSPLLAALGAARQVEHDRFGTATVTLAGGSRIDLARTRSERYPAPAALPVVTDAPIEQDLARRDFTINAAAFGLTGRHAGELLDPHDGMCDRSRREVRVLHEGSFRDDPTRLVRACRYAARVQGRMERATARWAKESLPGIAALSPARFGDAWRALLLDEAAPDALASRSSAAAARGPRARLDDRPERRRRARPTGALLGGGRPDHARRGGDRGAARSRRAASRRAGSARERVRATATTARHRSSTARVRGRSGVRACPGGRAVRGGGSSGTASRASGFTTTWIVTPPSDHRSMATRSYVWACHGAGGWRLAAPPQAGDLGRRTAARPCGAYRARGILGTIIPARAAGAARTDRRGTMTQPAETLSPCAVCGGPLTRNASADCYMCGQLFHLGLTTDSVVDDCGQVWLDDEAMALQFACNSCLEQQRVEAEGPVAEPEPQAAPNPPSPISPANVVRSGRSRVAARETSRADGAVASDAAPPTSAPATRRIGAGLAAGLARTRRRADPAPPLASAGRGGGGAVPGHLDRPGVRRRHPGGPDRPLDRGDRRRPGRRPHPAPLDASPPQPLRAPAEAGSLSPRWAGGDVTE